MPVASHFEIRDGRMEGARARHAANPDGRAATVERRNASS